MGLFNWFHSAGTPVDADTLIKRMSASRHDFEGLGLDEEGHPLDVFECGRLDVTGMRDKDSLYPSHETVAVICNRVKKKHVAAYYLSPHEFELKFNWKDGGSVKVVARLDRTTTSSLSSWLLRNIKEPGKSVTAEALSRLVDRRFASDAPPEWLNVINRVDIDEPEPPSEPEAPPAPSIADLKPGVVVFDHYRIEKELGAGGQGKVFLATNTQTVVEAHRRVVLKVLHCDTCADETSLHEFIKEANTLSVLKNDGIAGCYWCQPLGDVPILAMEYIEGVPLDKYLAEHGDGKISEAETRDLLLPIADALDYAHKRGIYHRDVKPQNIIVRATPKYGIKACLLDFGIASREQASGPTTTFWNVRGTLQYMSPEQKMVGRKPSASMDVYSLAVTAYECIMGDMPYPDGWDSTVKPTPIPSNTPFAKAVMRGLAMMPKDRPATCRELIDPKESSDSTGGGRDTGNTDNSGNTGGGGGISDLSKLERTFILYRQLLAQSATKIERENQDRAQWFRNAQGKLRDLTQDLRGADAKAIVRVFDEIKDRMRAERMSPDDFFPATDRLVELRSGLPEKGGGVWQSIKNSIG